MLVKIMFYVILTLALLFLIWTFIRWFERNNIYFPSWTMSATPESIGLGYEDAYFITEDDVEINGWFIPSGGISRATVLFCHGNAGNISDRLDIIRILNGLDLDVFIFDYRGYGASGGRPSERGTYFDAMAAYNYLLSEKNIDRNDIIIYGKSLGGSIALDLATKVDARALIIDSTFTSIEDMVRELYPYLPGGFMNAIKYDNLSKIGKVSMPKLIIHSHNDEIVPFSHGGKLFHAATEPKDFYSMRGGHNDTHILFEKQFSGRIDEFLREYCSL